MNVAFGISLLFYREAEILRYFISNPVMAVIFDLPLTPTSECFLTSSAVMADLKNVGILEFWNFVGISFGISLLCCIQAEI